MFYAEFHGKQTKFQPLFARKCQKRLKKLQYRNLARNFKHTTIVFDYKNFITIIYTK